MMRWKEMRALLEEECERNEALGCQIPATRALRAALARLDAAEYALYDGSDDSYREYVRLRREQDGGAP